MLRTRQTLILGNWPISYTPSYLARIDASLSSLAALPLPFRTTTVRAEQTRQRIEARLWNEASDEDLILYPLEPAASPDPGSTPDFMAPTTRYRVTYQLSAGLNPAYSTIGLAVTACSPTIDIDPFIAFGSIIGSANGTPKTPRIGVSTLSVPIIP